MFGFFYFTIQYKERMTDDDKNQLDQSQVPHDDQDTAGQAPQDQNDTTDDDTNTSLGGSDQHDEDSNATNSQTNSDDLSWEEKYRRVEQKVSKLESEKTQFQRSAEQIANWVVSDPSRAKQAFVELRGMSEQDADQYVQQLRQDQNLDNNGVNNGQNVDINQQTNPNLDPAQITNFVRQAYKQEQENQNRDRAYKSFFGRFPEMDPKNVPVERKDEVIQLATKIDNLSLGFQAVGYSLDESLDKAYKELSGKTQEEIEQARNKGKYDAMANRNAQNGSTFTNEVVGRSGKKSSFKPSNQAEQDMVNWGLIKTD